MTSQDRFNATVAGSIWPFLKERGFKRSKGTFHRRVGSAWQVVDIQKSVCSDRSLVRFTVNLGVGIDSLRDEVHTWADGNRPIESRCQLRERLGPLLQGKDA